MRSMRIGVISDVHANLPALEAALDFLRAARVDEILCLGDVVGYGPHPNEVIERLRAEKIPTTLGGHDLKVAYPSLGATGGEEKEASLAWTREQLTPENLVFLKQLPPFLKLDTPYGRLRAFHGHPEDPERRFPLEEAEEILARLRARLVLAGGRHVPILKRYAGVVLMDPGSVGLSLSGEPGADVAILNVSKEKVSARTFKLPYEFGRTAFDLKAWGLPDRIAEVIQRGAL